MANYTPKLNLRKPTTGEYYDMVADLNDTKDKIDNHAGAVAGQINAVNAQLSEIPNQSYITDKLKIIDFNVKAVNYTKYGKIEMPSDFPIALPFTLFRGFDGKVVHDINVQSMKPSKKYYISESGNDSNDGLSEATPIRTLVAAVEKAQAVPVTAIELIILDEMISVSWFSTGSYTFPISVYLSSKHDRGSAIGNFAILTWVADSGIYKVSRSGAVNVYDYDRPDMHNNPSEMIQVTTLAECQAKINTWYTDGVSVWINKPGMTAGKSYKVAVGINYAYAPLWNISGKNLTLDNIAFLMPQSASVSSGALYVIGDATSTFISYKCRYKYSKYNGLSTSGAARAYIIESYAALNAVDGFNYKGDGDELVFEYNSYAHDNGTAIEGSANATTAHNGLSIIRVGAIGEECYGPLLADVNGCYSVNIDCKMYNSKNAGASAFFFSDTGSLTPGKAYLINCDGGGKDTYSVAGTPEIPIKLINFKGTNIAPNAKTEHLIAYL